MYDCISVFHAHVVYILFKLRGIKNFLHFETVSFISTVSFYINLHTSENNTTLIMDTLVSCLFLCTIFVLIRSGALAIGFSKSSGNKQQRIGPLVTCTCLLNIEYLHSGNQRLNTNIVNIQKHGSITSLKEK